ncbi:MAG TPA: FAD binding domain-containing protein [Solirubrobacteraceae bacterium]|jgi:CO/xanthine dehydrogenase FAD-binding subunit|nr:FAD binding domain-containing protein [Solirubrobacteraceae bacterium]
MEVLIPDTWQQALELKATHPGAVPIAGGTDLMVELNFDRIRPATILDLTRVEELAEWGPDDGNLRVGAGVTYARLIAELGKQLPGLAIASRTVGSPQIRNRGTVGGNLGTSSPAGDGLPPLFAADAEVELASMAGTRRIPVHEFVTGPKRNCLAEDELIAAFHIPPADGPQQFAKIGTRNAMVIAACSLALTISSSSHTVAACIGSAGPTPIRAIDAEGFIAAVLDEEDLWSSRRPIAAAALARFGELVEQAARPIDDVRGTAAYRHHALGVLGRRTLSWAWEEYRCA